MAGDVLATGWFGARNGGVAPGARVAVVGCGAVGLCAIAGAREEGAEVVVAVDPAPDRRALAERFGAETTDVENSAEVVGRWSEGRGADVVVEAVGSPAATRLAFELVRTGGTISAVGVHHEPALAVSPGALYDKNLTYRAGRCPARALLEPALGVVARGTYPLGALVSHRLPLDRAPEAYAAFERREPGWTKVVFLPATD